MITPKIVSDTAAMWLAPITVTSYKRHQCAPSPGYFGLYGHVFLLLCDAEAVPLAPDVVGMKLRLNREALGVSLYLLQHNNALFTCRCCTCTCTGTCTYTHVHVAQVPPILQITFNSLHLDFVGTSSQSVKR